MRARFAIAALLAMALACSEDELKAGPPPSPQPVPLTIWNSTQHPLEEVRVHSDTMYLNAANLLSAEYLPHDGRVLVEIIAGQHVTVIRRNVEGGQRIAFTTASGLNVRTPGYVLQVFQESFRLHEPEFQDGGNDGGDARGDADDGAPADGGDPAMWGDDVDGGDDFDGDVDGGPTDGGEPEGGDA